MTLWLKSRFTMPLL